MTIDNPPSKYLHGFILLDPKISPILSESSTLARTTSYSAKLEWQIFDGSMLVALGTTKSMKRLLGTSFITEWVRALQAQPPLLTQIRFLSSSPSARRNCVKVWVSLPLLYLANFSFFGLRLVGLEKYCYKKAILRGPWEKMTSVLHRNDFK